MSHSRASLRLIGVVHVRATPGAPRYGGSMVELLDAARSDAAALAAGGCDALIVENFGDVPFHAEHVPSETIAALALAVSAVRAGVGERFEIGVNVLRNDARAALGLCAATGAQFLRVNVHTGAAVTDQGLVQGRAAETLRERARLCPRVAVWADVHVKHASPLAHEKIEECAADTVLRGLADAVIVSGAATGSAPEPARVAAVRSVLARTPIYLGSGVNESNAAALLAAADGAIVGTALKHDGRVEEPVDVDRVKRLRRVFDALRPAR
ncbi:MAG: BtpA/SgcQ family protein [Planctomycetes bacterium]|nr:BtpA/SgcQ family protein [Planctomycetota bacterium]